MRGVQSAATLAYLLASAAISAGILWWSNFISHHYHGLGLSGSFYYLFTVLDQTAPLGLIAALIAAIFIAGSGWVRGVAAWVSDHVNVIALCTVVVLSAGCLFVYDNHPLAMDEYSAWFQGRVFAAGHLSGQFPPALLDYLVPPGFQNYFLHISRTTGAVAASYWPSFALLLTPFTWAGIAWACNPCISALTLLVIHRLALQLFADREAAGLAVLLTLASPVFFADGISYYSMPAHLLANCLYALMLLTPTPRRALLAGVIGSVALTLHNPVPHLLFAIPWFLWIARRPDAGRLLACLCAGYLPVCLLLGIGWFEFLNSLHNADTVAAAAMPNSAAPHTFIDSMANMLGSIFSLPTLDVLYARAIGLAKVWVWSVPGLMILAVAGAWKLRGDPRCRLFVSSALVTLLGYLLVPVDQGHGWGFRYFHSAWMMLPLLAAGALTRFAAEDLRAFVTACALACLVVADGQRAEQIHRYVAAALYNLPHYNKSGPQFLFINPNGFYTKDLVQNDPWLRSDRVLMMSHGSAQDAQMMHDRFPQMRRVVEGPQGSVWVK